MQHLNSSEYNLISMEANSKHAHLNPKGMTKAYTNSYLEDLDNIYSNHKPIHSEVNFLDLSKEPNISNKVIPERPPPPLPPKPNFFGQPLIEITTDKGFEDDFSLIKINEERISPPTRPPPLPPLPQKPIFSLFEDFFEPVKLQNVQNIQAPVVSDQSIEQSAVPPPLPPLPSVRPAPPLPPKPNLTESYFDELSDTISRNINEPPPLPPPPKLPPRIPRNFQPPQISLNDEFDDFFSKRENTSTNQQNDGVNSIQKNPFDPFGSSFVNEEISLPPPRMNHFS